MRLYRLLLCAVPFVALPAFAQQQAPGAAKPLVVGSKPFGESYLLAEMFAQVLESRGIPVIRRPGLGATEIAFRAFRQGALDVFPEYTGTGLMAVLHDSLADSLARNPTAV
ncbi:MAG TPA: glycine betaine ABC transporter substrate-binding protein, partial [Gemmatimonadaceae bacterium]|nr:glycine betaine ABC transporter substrate-binding protein [Gemmatimonadaceae bacterium]